MLGDLVYEMAGTGLRTPEIEEARQAAWIAISALAKTLQAEGFAPQALWKAAFGATESWIELLDYRQGLCRTRWVRSGGVLGAFPAGRFPYVCGGQGRVYFQDDGRFPAQIGGHPAGLCSGIQGS